MAGRWVKAAFLATLGIVILLYTDKFVTDMRTAFEDRVTLVWTWDLLKILMWILVAWLFVDAGLTVALSFSEHRYSLADVMARLDSMEKKMRASRPREIAPSMKAVPVEPEGPAVTEGAREEEPPPPVE